MKTIEQILRDAAEYIRKNGFSPHWISPRGLRRGCFSHAIAVVTTYRVLPYKVFRILEDVIGPTDWSPRGLIAAGWDDTATKDAVAACRIAADLAAEER
jgi:hypothetical protein